MKVDKLVDNDVVVLRISGRVDTATSPDLEAAFDEAVSTATSVVFDCAELEYVSSAGLRVLLKAQKAMNAKGGDMKLVGVNEIVMEVLDITGFSDILTVE